MVQKQRNEKSRGAELTSSPQLVGNEGDTPAAAFALRDVNLVLRWGTRTAVVGGVGSGKSSLLSALLGDLRLLMKLYSCIRVVGSRPWS